MTLLDFLSPYLHDFETFKIVKNQSRLEIFIYLVSTELSENLQLSIVKVNSQNGISVYLRDKNVFGSDSYVLNKFSTLKDFQNENMCENLAFDKFCELIKKYENLQTK